MNLLMIHAFTGCAERDTLAGSWDGEWKCDSQEFDVEAVISEVETYEYTGEMLFRYSKSVTDGTFYANLLYSFEVTQLLVAGNQDLFFDMEWSDLGCKTIFDDGTEEKGGCVANGLNTDDYESDIGDVPIRFDGVDRLIIDDDNCQGILYR